MKILIIGSGGSGKSTLARKLGELTGIPVIHLDAYYWRPGWEATPDEEWVPIVRQLVEQREWIMDGNFASSLDIRLQAADAVICFDLPSWLTLWGVIKRRFQYRGKSRPDIAEGCPEKLDRDFIRWVWRFKKDNLPIIMEKLKPYAGRKRIILIRTRREAAALLDKVAERGTEVFRIAASDAKKE